MVKYLIYFAIILFFNGCFYYKNTNGIIRANKTVMHPFKNVENDTELDTFAVYSYFASFQKSKNGYNHYKLSVKNLDEFSDPLLRFYPNGKVSLFNHNKLPLNKEFFNPANGLMGYYGRNKKGELIIKILYFGDGSGYEETCSFTIVNDTIESINIVNGWGSSYKCILVPREYLEGWQPDW